MSAKAANNRFPYTEVAIAFFITAVLVMLSYNVMTSQKKIRETKYKYINARQNARVSLESLEEALRLAGINVDEFNGQPVFLDAAPYQIVFNADISGGVFGTSGMTVDQRVPLHDGTPYTVGSFPGENIGLMRNYNNNAETIRYTLDRNDNGRVAIEDRYTETGNPYDYAIYREENGERKFIVGYGIRGGEAYPDGNLPQPLFKYYGDYNNNGAVTLWGDRNGDGMLNQAEISTLTAVSRNMLDRIRDVEIFVEVESSVMEAGFAGSHSIPGSTRNYRSFVLTSRVRPGNTNVAKGELHACGDPPEAPSQLTAEDTPGDNGSSITVTFKGSMDELAGEEDITQYTVYRKREGARGWTCIASVVTGGTETYSIEDNKETGNRELETGVNYYYYATAWDCRPQESDPSNTAGPVQSVANGPSPPFILQAYDTPCDTLDEITVVLKRSSEDLAECPNVSFYRVFRGCEEAGEIRSRELIGTITADGSETYILTDNFKDNLSGTGPEAQESYYYTAEAVSLSDSTPSVLSNEFGGVYYTASISSARLTDVRDFSDNNGKALSISWTASPSENCADAGIKEYVLKRKAVFELAWSDVYSVSACGAPSYDFVDTGLSAGTQYTYCVWTVGRTGEVPSNKKGGIPTLSTEFKRSEEITGHF
ncbi:MAG: fibronectin type III domain-containing protein [Candidatus Krumholzibacteriota bacterium]|nr:fibronectin type III domain-containing protein [Candidatus Krumholzibacteriota bacterium]